MVIIIFNRTINLQFLAMIIFALIFLAGTCNAIQDTIAHHWDTSIFARIRSDFWRRWFQSDWRNRPGHPIWFLWDAWHCFKMIEKLCYILIIQILIKDWFFTLLCAGLLGLTFNAFYKYILIRKS